MAPWTADVQERRRTYEGCRDLHQTRSVLAALSGGGRALREREPPFFGPMQEDLRICFETPEDGQEPRGGRAWGADPYCSAEYLVRCNMASLRDGVKKRTGNFIATLWGHFGLCTKCLTPARRASAARFAAALTCTE